MFFAINYRDLRRFYRRFLPDEKVMKVVALKLDAMTMDRFDSQGASGGVPWAPKKAKSWGYDDGRAILTGPSGLLLKAWGQDWSYGEATNGNFVQHSLIHQVGTVGRGGMLPTIRPKKAKALFIPITDKANHSARLVGHEADFQRRMTGQLGWGEPADHRPMRFGVTMTGGRSSKPSAIEYGGLIKGRLKDGRLQRWNASTGVYEDGVPDFIFLQKVDVPPRPMLPTSPNERADAIRSMIDFMLGRTVPRF